MTEEILPASAFPHGSLKGNPQTVTVKNEAAPDVPAGPKMPMTPEEILKRCAEIDAEAAAPKAKPVTKKENADVSNTH